ncbi:hypothetical protein [Nonomuraea sp. NPDC049625]|uniref:hypothetical protein n=1 Tax=Nonomuraea sp. NPDC049625 TaxID=3155775 RepID=UPI0034387B53
MRNLAERQSAVVADLEARVESAPEAARQWLADTANFHRSTMPNITAVADTWRRTPSRRWPKPTRWWSAAAAPMHLWGFRAHARDERRTRWPIPRHGRRCRGTPTTSW